jgi:tetratricopeptide (TPR) repeat protein
MKRLILPLLALLAMPATLHAKWLEASSNHFVIYADDKPAELRQFSGQLERFHASMALLLSRGEVAPPSPSNRVTVYVVRDQNAVRKLAGDGPKFLYAFYNPRAGGSFAIVPAVEAQNGTLDFSMIALLHEYAHHFQLSAAHFPWPRWFVEGSAEFFASARFDKDGTVMLGLPANHRAGEFLYAPDVTATDLLDPEAYEKRHRKSYDAYYGKSWLLYHYLTFSADRKGQFDRYLQLLQQGKSSPEAGKAAFGDLTQLERDLDKYLRRPKITAIRMNTAMLQPGPVTIRDLSAGEAAIMPVRVRSRRGVNRKQALELLPEARSIAARFPKDAAVLTALAEAEHDAGNDDAAIQAADAALAIDATQVNAYVQKGYALFRKAEDAPDKSAAIRAAREPFIALNKIENDHPLPLIYFYLGQQRLGPLNKLSISALERAVQLAPFDLELRFMLVMQQIHDKRYDEAATNLTPIAYSPHGGTGTERARTLLDRLNTGKDLEPADLEALMREKDPAGGKEPATDE